MTEQVGGSLKEVLESSCRGTHWSSWSMSRSPLPGARILAPNSQLTGEFTRELNARSLLLYVSSMSSHMWPRRVAVSAPSRHRVGSTSGAGSRLREAESGRRGPVPCGVKTCEDPNTEQPSIGVFLLRKIPNGSGRPCPPNMENVHTDHPVSSTIWPPGEPSFDLPTVRTRTAWRSSPIGMCPPARAWK